jgi:hypothetical protein
VASRPNRTGPTVAISGILQHEIRRYQPQADKVATIDRAVTTARQRTQLLDDYRRRAKYDLDALAEITKLIRPRLGSARWTWIARQSTLPGESNDAAGLLKTLGWISAVRAVRVHHAAEPDTNRRGIPHPHRAVGGVGWQPKQQQASANSGQPGFLGGQFMEMPAAAPVVSPPPPALLPIPGGAGVAQ